MAPSAFETTFWVTTRASSSRNGWTADAAARASAMRSGSSSPGTISPSPSMATASIRSATHRLRGALLGQEQIIGGIEVVAERTIEIDEPGAGGRGGCRVGGMAVASETHLDGVGWGEQQR